MRTRADGAALDMVRLDPGSGVPLYRQLAEAVQEAIRDKSLAAGVRLPATRVLMKGLNVSRNTVLSAFEQLATDGYILSRPGSGAYVAAKTPVSDPKPVLPGNGYIGTLPQPLNPPPPPQALATAPPIPVQVPIQAKPPETLSRAARAAILADLPLSKLYQPGPHRPFRTSTPDWREFPVELWERLRTRVLRENAASLLNYGDPAGYAPLREALAGYLHQARVVRCTAAQIVITAGTQQALRLIAGVLVSPGDLVAIEEPGCFGAKSAFVDAGARVAPLLVDEEGPITPVARRHNATVVVYTTPAHQFPLGVRMTLPRRLGMLDFARQNQAWVVEDDYDGELRYDGQAPESLLRLDSHGSVIYSGNTSHLLCPALGIGYLVVPSSQVSSFVKANAIAGAAPPLLDQATLALLISEGHLARHVSHLKQVYQSRLKTLRQGIQRDLPDVFDLETEPAGLNMVGWLRRGWEEADVTSASLSAGLELTPLSAYGSTALMRPGFLFGFGGFTVEELQKAVARLVLALRAKPSARFSTAAPSSA